MYHFEYLDHDFDIFMKISNKNNMLQKYIIRQRKRITVISYPFLMFYKNLTFQS